MPALALNVPVGTRRDSSNILRSAYALGGPDALMASSSPEEQGHHSSRCSQEFDFSDVFGPIPSHPLPEDQSVDEHPSHQVVDPPRPEILAASSPALRELAAWAPPECISEGDPITIVHRTHSLVGPAVTPRHSFVGSLGGVAEEDGAKVVALADAIANHTLGGALDSSDGSSSDEDIAQMSSSGLPAALPAIPSCDSIFSAADPADVSGADNPPASTSSAPRVGPQDFDLLRVVGQGSFGKVFQVRQHGTGAVLAMKVMRKDRVLSRNHQDYMKAERDILTKVTHPFVVNLHYSFQTRTKLYLLLEFVNGGHLFFQLYRQGTFREELAKLYAAEIVSAVAHLHSQGIIHRDLKPENILLDADGHIKLTDFGLAKEVDSSCRANSLCGTLEYMAPEIILAKGHGAPADWWSVGVLLFEMLTGQPPFLHGNRQKLQAKIVKDKVKFPSFFSSEVHSLLKGLLNKDPSRRLGGGPGGSSEVLNHKFFKNMNWAKLERREIQPNFRPTVNGKWCTANFDEQWTKMPVQDSPGGTPTSAELSGGGMLSASPGTTFFRGYSFVAAPHVLAADHLPTVDSDDEEGDEEEEDTHEE